MKTFPEPSGTNEYPEWKGDTDEKYEPYNKEWDSE